MEIRGKAWRPGDLKSFYKAEYVCPAAYNDQAAAVEAATDRVRSELISHSGTKNDPNIYYNIDSSEYKGLINDVREKALKEGREEAWDLARRIATYGAEGAYTFKDVRNVFCTNTLVKVFSTPVEEALDKDKKYQEEKNALHIGDEVEFIACGTTRKGYIINLVSPALVRVLTKDLGTYPVGPEECKKTGKHNPDIEKVTASFEKGGEKDDGY